MTAGIRHAQTETDILRCWPLFHELRPHLLESEIVERVRRQQLVHGYELVYADADGEAVALAGYRVAEFLAWGRVLYVDDLVTAPKARDHGHGGHLLDWLVAEARRRECHEVHLDSGVQRFAAHRLYHSRQFRICCHHFSFKLA